LPFGETLAEQRASGAYSNVYKFTGKELDAETGLYYHGARYYDPEGSIWLSVDPLAGGFPSWGPYVYTLNNPVRLTDPTGMAPEGGEAVPEHIVLPSESEAKRLVDDWNRIYENKYGFKNAFQVVTRPVDVQKQNPKYGWLSSFWTGEKEFISVKEDRSFIVKNKKFDWKTDKYTSSISDIIDSQANIFADIVNDRSPGHGLMVIGGLLEDYGGGFTVSPEMVILSNKLTETLQGNNAVKNNYQWTLGGVALHEFLYHVSPLGKQEGDPNIMRTYYNQKTGKTHPAGHKQNPTLR
jgi:RHS repeat-associated protein